MMSAPKDTQIAMNVQQMAAYGYFKEEFLYYGYAFKRGEQIVYRLSEDRASLYSHYYQSVFEDALPTPVHELLKSVVVPAGEQQRYRLQIKMELIQTLRSAYDETYYNAIALLQGAKPTDSAAPLLEAYLHEHILQTEKRQLFDGACQQALEAKLLSPSRYRALLQTADRLYGQPQPLNKPLTGRGKTLSGFAYGNKSDLSCYTSATLEDTYCKYHQLLSQGVLCTPIIQRSYWYDSPNDYKAVRQSFKDLLQSLTAESAIVALTAQLKQLPSAVSAVHYQLALEDVRAHSTPQAYAALVSCGYLFNLITTDK